MLKLVVVVALCCCWSVCSAQNGGRLSPECRRIGHSVEDKFKEVVFLNDNLVPQNQSDLDKHCLNIKQTMKKLKQLRNKNCFNSFSRQMLNIMYPQLAKMIRNMCDQSSSVTLETIKCMPESDFDFLRECVKEVSRQSKWVADKEKDDRKLFPQACCVYRLGKNCFDKITETCTANPGRNPRQYWNQVLDSLMKNMDTLVCSRYDNEYCEQKGLFDQLSKIKYQGDPNEFLILPLLRVATRFTDDAQQ